jgi:hypothetical protein
MGYSLVDDGRVLSGRSESRRCVGYLDLRRRSVAVTAYRTSDSNLGCLVRAGAANRLRVLLDHRVNTPFRSSLQHSVVLVGRNDKHSVDAIVRLFGGLYYFVNLAANYEGADFFDTMVYDAQHGGLDKVCMSKQSFRRWTK